MRATTVRGSTAIVLAVAALASARCGRSTGARATDAADAPRADTGAEAPSPAPDGGAPDAGAPDAAIDSGPDAAAADGPADAPLEVPPAIDAGPDAATDGGCVPIVAPAVRWLNPLPQGNALRGVWGSSATDVYAVGDYGTILHSSDHGQSWQTLASGTTQALNAVWGSGANDVYAVGAQGTILHTTGAGSAWTQTTVGIGPGQNLDAVWGTSADDVYAVGDIGLIAHRVAQGAWTTRSQSSDATTPTYRAVTGSGGTVWIAGDNRSVIRSIDGGATWTDVTKPNAVYNLMAAVAVPGTLYVGALGFSSDANVFASTDGGTSWTPIRTPGGQATMGLAAGGGNVYAVGTTGMSQLAASGGTTFSSVATGVTQTLNAVWVSAAGESFVVGDTGVVLHADAPASTPTQTPAVTRADLDRVWGSPTGDLIAVGSLGDVVQSSDQGAHFALRTPTVPAGSFLPQRMTGLAGLGDDVYAAGDGAVMHSADRGVTWAQEYYINPDDIAALTINADGVYGAGDVAFTSMLYHKPPGGVWTTIPVARLSATMNDFWSGDGEMWTVGGTSAFHAVSGTFSPVTLPNVGGSAIWGSSAADLFTAGSNAAIMRSTDHGASWTVEHACWPPDQTTVQINKTISDLTGICGGGGRTYIVGSIGTVLVSRDDVNWTSVPVGTWNALAGCSVADDGTVTVVGAGGTILSLTFPP